jgi:hypothetical protein
MSGLTSVSIDELQRDQILPPVTDPEVRSGPRRVALLAVSLLIAAGMAIVVLAYHEASLGQTSLRHYDIFWVGMFLLFGPLLWLTLHGGLTVRSRLGVAALLGLAAYFPRFVRAPSMPLMYDELGHWEAAEQLYRTSKLFRPDDIVKMASYFPGLHTLTVGLRELTGLSTIRTATILVACFHILTLLGIFQITRKITHDDRTAGIAAAIYAVSPSFPFFDGMYAYESFAIPLLVWSVAAAVTALSERGRVRRAWLVISAVIGLTCVVTHHLSSYVLVVVLGILAICQFGSNRRRHAEGERAGDIAIVAGLLGAAAVAWAVVLHAPVISYLGVFPQQGLATLRQLVTKSTGGGQVVSGGAAAQEQTALQPLFGGSVLPSYERLASFVIQPLLLVAFAVGLWKGRRRRGGAFWALAILGSAYFVSLPMVLTPGGSAGAHRSWACSYIGLAVVVGICVAPLTMGTDRWARLWRWMAIIGICTVLMGNYASAVNDQERFPGPFVFGSDGRNVPNELVDLSQWFARTEGPGRIVLSDLRTYTVFGAYAEAQDPSEFPGWELFFPVAPPRPEIVTELRDDGIQFVVVDDRLATEPPQRGFYFASYEPRVETPLPEASVAKFDRISWLRAIRRTQHYTVYQVIGG